jgi:hypothetical protein
MSGRIRIVFVLALFSVGLMVATPPAQAVPTVYDLTGDHCSGGCGTPPFGNVSLVQNGTTVDVTVHLNSPNEFVKTGAADFQAFKFNATDVVLGDITVDQTVSGETLAAQTGAFNGNGTGSFIFGIACTTCGGGSSDKFDDDIVFHVANALIADLTHPNGDGILFVADIIGSTGNTGPVYATGPRPPQRVPAPAALTLVGTAFVALGMALRHRARS